MRRLLFLLSFFIFNFASNFAFAASQVGNSHKLGVGIQLGFPGNGLSFNYFFTTTDSLQLSPSFWVKDDWQGIGARIDYLHWYELPANLTFGSLFLYVGPGINVYSLTWQGDKSSSYEDSLSFGLELPIGLSLRFAETPIDLGFEFIPVLSVSTRVDVYGSASFIIRYYF